MRFRSSAWLTIALLALTQPLSAEEKGAGGASVGAALPTAVGRPLSLADCRRLAQQNFPKLQQVEAQLAQKEAQDREATYSPIAKFNLEAGLATVPTYSGSPIYSPNSDVVLNANMAFAWSTTLKGVIPLWTFGKLENLRKAAAINVEVGREELRKARSELDLDVHRAYFGVQFARDGLRLLREAEGVLDEQLAKTRQRVSDEDADEIDLIKLQLYRQDLSVRRVDAEKQLHIAEAGLRFLVGSRTAVAIEEGPLQPTAQVLAPQLTYLSAARLHRPELAMARLGVRAREAQFRGKQANLYPDFGLALSGGFAFAPSIADQTNPFLGEKSNYVGYGIALGLKWDLDFLGGVARADQAAAQLAEMQALERYALGAIGVEVEEAYAKALEAQRRMKLQEEAVALTKRWLLQVRQGLEVGVAEEKEVVEPAKEYATKRVLYMNAVYDFNVAMARLAVVTGWEPGAAR